MFQEVLEMWGTVVLVVVTAVTALWAYVRHRHNYWTARGVPTAAEGLPFFGHITKGLSRKEQFWIYMEREYKKYRSTGKMLGMYSMLKPSLVVWDPDLVKAILIKDFDHFVDRRNFALKGAKRDQVFNHVLTNATGNYWKSIRSALSPSFTSGKMKGMFHLVEQKADQLVHLIQKGMKSKPSLPLKHTFGKYTLEIIASCAFGIETQSLDEEASVFSKKVDEMFTLSGMRLFRTMLLMVVPKLVDILKISVTAPEIDYFTEVIREAIRQREVGKKRGDFLDLMLETRERQKNDPNAEVVVTEQVMVANSVVFILAGYDTTANTLSFLSFMLAQNPAEQHRLRQELQDIVAREGGLTYQSVVEAKFLDACISEALRLAPPAHVAERQCTKDYNIPETNITIPNKMMVAIPVWSLHHDPQYWDEPEQFRPDRFLPENRDQIHSGTYLPFGLGPRNCIGMRFALLEAKLAMAKLLLNFELECEPGKDQLQFSKDPGVMRPTPDLSLIFTPLPPQQQS